MTRRRGVVIFLAVGPLGLLGLLGLAGPPPAKTLREQLVGTWKIVSYQRRDTEGQPWVESFGSKPAGCIVYDQTGHMAVQIARMPRSPFASGDDWKPTPEEAREAYLGYIAYFGTYTVDEAARAVTHHVEGSLRPSFAGTDQVRPAMLDGDRLTLSDGKTFKVVWERARP